MDGGIVWEAVKAAGSLISAGAAVVGLIRSRDKKATEAVEAVLRGLNPRLLYLLLYMDKKGVLWPPRFFAPVLAEWKNPGRGQALAQQQGNGWEQAAEYAAFYLVSLGLVQYGANYTEIRISPLGSAVVQFAFSDKAFEQVFTTALPS